MRYLKRTPAIYTNLTKPEGRHLEDFVLNIEAFDKRCMDKDQFESGAAFLDALLWCTLDHIAHVSGRGLAVGWG